MINFGLGNGGGLTFNANKTSNAGSRADSDPGIVIKDHLDENITGKSFFLSFNLGTAANDHLGLDGNNGGKNFEFETHGANTSFESIDDLVFVTGVSVDNVPGGVNTRGIIGKLELEFFFVGESGCFGHYFLGWRVGVEIEAGVEASTGRMSTDCVVAGA